MRIAPLGGWLAALAALALATACGRIGFPPVAGGEDAGGEDATSRADSSAPMMLSLGDHTGAINGVTVDTTLVIGTQSWNLGAHTDLHLNNVEDSILIRFDLSVVPPSAVVTSAHLQFRVVLGAIPAGYVLRVFPMLQAWAEGTGDETNGVPNYTTAQTGVPWAAPGAQPPSRTSDPSTEITIGPLGIGGYVTVPLPPALIQTWMLAPAGNHGVALTGSMSLNELSLGAREWPAQSFRPLLVLELE